MKCCKGQLVCQHLEKISRDALEKYQDIIRDHVRGQNGIYALYRGDRLYYVGLATNLNKRLKQHLKDRHAETWDRFSVYLTVNDEHLRELEALVLKIISPKGNKLSGRFIESQDLRRDIMRAYDKRSKMERDSLFGYAQSRVVKPTKKIVGGNANHKPVLADYINKSFKIRLTLKGKLYKANVRKNGAVIYKGKIYNSPSMAGKAAVGRPVNGWMVWKFEHAPGEWVALDILRNV